MFQSRPILAVLVCGIPFLGAILICGFSVLHLFQVRKVSDSLGKKLISRKVKFSGVKVA